jgi:hypothetical protein
MLVCITFSANVDTHYKVKSIAIRILYFTFNATLEWLQLAHPHSLMDLEDTETISFTRFVLQLRPFSGCKNISTIFPKQFSPQWRILIRRSGLAEGYALPSARPEFRIRIRQYVSTGNQNYEFFNKLKPLLLEILITVDNAVTPFSLLGDHRRFGVTCGLNFHVKSRQIPPKRP